ncbi:MAG TPA: DNA-3-methyladenine glycosylase, partial [Solirubrobacteraceae bacterium]|nr:DNA-3-methyladenine glycosylase [Solirubrobacteraceae bacterium]
HHSEPASHAYAGLTPRTETLFGPPGRAYVYRSYGVHAMLNTVCEPEGVGAGVLIRALAPVRDLEAMRRRRGGLDDEQLCSGPGRLTQALGIWLDENGADLAHGSIRIEPRSPGPAPALLDGLRIGITRGIELPWRYCLLGNRHVSKPWPARTRLRGPRT